MMKMANTCALVAAAIIVLVPAGCRMQPTAAADSTATRGFLSNLAAIEGLAFEGRVDESETPGGTFVGERLVMHVREVTPGGATISLHVGEDRSRTWILTRQSDGRLHLRHDHRHPDGTPHDLTDYGGFAVPGGTASVQTFPADEATAAMLPEAATNIWRMEIHRDEFVYALSRHGEPRFRAVFALAED